MPLSIKYLASLPGVARVKVVATVLFVEISVLQEQNYNH